MSNIQPVSDHPAVSPILPTDEFGLPSRPDVHLRHNQSVDNISQVTFVETKGRFTPASTFGAEEDSWNGKSRQTRIVAEHVFDSEDHSPVRQKADKSPRRKISRRNFSWTWQIVSAFFGVAGLMAIVAVLISIDRHPRLADWTLSSSSKLSPTISSNVSPNTLIAIFAAICKAALLVAVADCIGQLKWNRFEDESHVLKELEVYDEASRGPWGALKLLGTVGHTGVLASFGACITIISIAIDPFAQQLLAHVPRTVVASNASASYQVARMYDTGLQSINSAVLGANIDATMQGAIFNGIYSLNAPNPVTCSTANCQWTQFATLAVCSSCKDVSAATKVICGSSDPLFNGTGGPQTCNYTTPSGLNLSATTFADAHHGGFFSTLLNSTAATQTGEGDFWTDSLLINTATLFLPPIIQNSASSVNYNIPPAEVTECSLRWCATMYEGTSVRSNILNTSRTRDFALQTVGHPFVTNNSVDLSVWEPAKNDRSSIPGNATLLINAMDHANTGNYLASIFTVSQMTKNANAKAPSTNDIGNALLKTRNISLTVDNLAKSMSTRIRTGPNATLATGQALRDETFIEVQWLWIILPAATVFCAVLFLVLTMWRSARADAPVWMSSSLAMLLHDMTGYYGAERFDAKSEMESVAKKVSVRLVRGNSDRWGFERMA